MKDLQDTKDLTIHDVKPISDEQTGTPRARRPGMASRDTLRLEPGGQGGGGGRGDTPAFHQRPCVQVYPLIHKCAVQRR